MSSLQVNRNWFASPADLVRRSFRGLRRVMLRSLSHGCASNTKPAWCRENFSSSRNIFVLAYAARQRACGEDWSGSGQHWKNRKLNDGDTREQGGSIRDDKSRSRCTL